jgi:GT2 family glycosyltransferase
VDLCRYAVTRDLGCVVAHDAVVYHAVARSSGGTLNPRSYYYQTRNRIYLANRWLPWPWKLLFHAYYLPSRLLLQAIGKGRWRWRTLRAISRGLVDGYRGVTGKWKNH